MIKQKNVINNINSIHNLNDNVYFIQNNFLVDYKNMNKVLDFEIADIKPFYTNFIVFSKDTLKLSLYDNNFNFVEEKIGSFPVLSYKGGYESFLLRDKLRGQKYILFNDFESLKTEDVEILPSDGSKTSVYVYSKNEIVFYHFDEKFDEKVVVKSNSLQEFKFPACFSDDMSCAILTKDDNIICYNKKGKRKWSICQNLLRPVVEKNSLFGTDGLSNSVIEINFDDGEIINRFDFKVLIEKYLFYPTGQVVICTDFVAVYNSSGKIVLLNKDDFSFYKYLDINMTIGGHKGQLIINNNELFIQIYGGDLLIYDIGFEI